MDSLEAPLILFAVLGFVAFFIWNRSRARLERHRLELDAQAQMLDRIGPGQPLADFLATEEGGRFVELLTVSRSEPPRKDMRTQIFVLTTLGLIALFGGIFLVNAVLLPNLLVAEPSVPTDIVAMLALPAFLLTGGGAGALVAAWVMHRMAKKWQLLPAPEPD